MWGKTEEVKIFRVVKSKDDDGGVVDCIVDASGGLRGVMKGWRLCV